MCSFGSCQTRFEFLSQFRKVRNAFECFVTQVQTRLPKTKRIWPMKINVICTVPLCLTYSEVILFADDTTLYASKHFVQLYDTINSDLAEHMEWSRANKLALNTSKAHYMSFSPVKDVHSYVHHSAQLCAP